MTWSLPSSKMSGDFVAVVTHNLKMKISLHIYDLSQGIAKTVSPMLLGQTIEAVYHTGVVVAETEYYYGAGIQSEPAGQTHFGVPLQQMEMGETTKTQDEIRAFLNGVQSRYTESTYNLIEHNCNHFSDEFLQFLCDKKVPEHIVHQGAAFLQTPLGRMVAPMLQSSALGIPGASLPTPGSTRISPSPPTKAGSITIEKPLFFVPKESDLAASQDCIIAKYGEKGQLSEGSAFQAEFSRLTRAVLDKAPCDVSLGVVKSVCDELSQELNSSTAQDERFIRAALDYLSCVCLSSDQSSITDSCMPLHLLELQDTLPGSVLESLYRYIHNWFVQLRGMHDFRNNADRYLDFFIIKLVRSSDSMQRLYGYRLLYTVSRIFTKKMTIDAQTLLCELLINAVLDATAKAAAEGPDRKPNVQIANLASGALGRLVLTADDKASPNGWYSTAQKALVNAGLLSLRAPCCTDLHEYLHADEGDADLF
ncbi:Putative peptidase domain protein [Giardia duodenalis]|uniref:Putative peptidase domain protein n=1 Tax=Giardia intestinalis TaxID=5741 RepID=V6TBU5_GIAIN|nr:Putative peptidase domain protein [Giardia intestinalis]